VTRPSGMRPPSAPLLAAPLLAVALLLGACGSPTPSPGRGATFPSSPTAAPTVAPQGPAVPPASDPVTGVGTVIEVPGGTPELCLGPVRESYPPQCEGIPLAGWSWAEHPAEQTANPDGPSTSWGSYAVTGTFDGLTLTVTSAVPLALYDTVAEPSPRPMAPPDLTAAQWADVETGVRLLPGLLTSAREGDTGPVYVDVVHDDGTLQAWADASFGVGAVRVTSALR
jgi:hypothetical protein